MPRKKKTALEAAPVAALVDVLPAAVSSAEIDAAFDEMVALHRSATLDYAIRMGEVVIRRFFAGSLAAWRQRGQDDPSVRSLAAKVDSARLPGMSVTTMYRSIEIYDLECRVGVSGRHQLNAGHARAVLGLTDKQQEALLGRAEANDWTAERLDAEVARLRKREGKGKGRPPLPGFLKTIRAIDRLASAGGAFDDLDQIDGLSDADAEALTRAVASTMARWQEVAAALAARKTRR
jgi:hypothetical protein